MTKSENVSSKQFHMTGGKQENRISKKPKCAHQVKACYGCGCFFFWLDIELSISHFIHIN